MLSNEIMQKKGALQHFYPGGKSQMIPASAADILRLATESPSHIIHSFLKLLCVGSQDKWVHEQSPLKELSQILTNPLVSWVQVPLVPKARCSGDLVSGACPKGWDAQGGAQIPHSPGRGSGPARPLTIVHCCTRDGVWGQTPYLPLLFVLMWHFCLSL